MLDPVALHARAAPGKLACVDFAQDARFTYRAFDAAIAQLAGYFAARLGPVSGRRIAILSKNSAFMAMVHYACARAGAVFVPLNWRLAAPEIAYLMEDAAPDLLIWEAEFDELAEPVRNRFDSSSLFRLDGNANPLFDAAANAAPLAHTLDKDENAPITLLYTSGTSGRPKGVIVSEKSALFSALNYVIATRLTHASVFLCDMPLFHVAGLLAALRGPLFTGGTVLISQKFDPPVTLSRLLDDDLGVTHYFCVTQMAAVLREASPPQALKRLSKLTCFQTGGAPNPPASVRRWVEDGVRMTDGFGMTELGTAIGMPPGDLSLIARKAGSVGLPAMFTEVRLTDDQGKEVSPGEVGELWLRGPNVSPGYWNRPEATQATFGTGWLKSGDAGRRDEDGFHYIVDRIKDMYISGGENVYPVEVEAVLAELDGVLDCAVIGVPDPRWGESGVAFIVQTHAASIDEASVIAHCRARLAAFKVPKTIVFVPGLPRTPSGKIQKHLLAEQWTDQDG